MAAERLGIAILAYGEGNEHGSLVESLLAQGIEPGSLLIVHNPARAGEAPVEAPAGCEVLRAERNLGYAGGMNLAIARLRERGADPVLLLTHDARLRKGALDALLEAAERRPDCGVLGPALVIAGTDTPFSFGGITRWTGSNAHLRRRPESLPDGVNPCDWIDGGTMLLRADLLAAIGGFDERFWGYFEEADLCLRARRHGAAVGVVVDAVADQAPGGPKRPGPWAYLLTRNGVEYARRSAGARGAVVMIARAAGNTAYELVRALARALRLRAGPAGESWAIAVGNVRGLLDFLRRRWGAPPPDLPGMGDLRNA